MLDLSKLSDAVRYEGGISRRLFLSYGAALASLTHMSSKAIAADRHVSFTADPFQLGVASGDPDHRSVVLWTRLAPQPLVPDSGMTNDSVAVDWEVASDEGFSQIVTKGTAAATPQLGHSVHVVAKGLKPDRWYFYRFRAGDAVSPVGRTRTLPSPESTPETLKFAFASCQHYETGLYTAYEQMARDNPDLVFHLGDYIYEGAGRENLVRKHLGNEIQTLSEYRTRYALYRSDPLLNRMHAVCPWVVTWDDHEFENNYANDISEDAGVDPVAFLQRRANAYQAYYEIMPLRPRSLPQGPHMQLFRKGSFGRLADFLVLDTRQYRTDQPNNDKASKINEEALNPKATMLGGRQRGWLQSQLIRSEATWNILAQQVMMGMVQSFRQGQEGLSSMDQWPGYAYERMELMRFIADRKVPNPIVLTGDIHSNWANELHVDDRQPDTPPVAVEFVGTSISSGGNGKAFPEYIDALKSANPFVKFHNTERGYVRCEVTPKQWKTDYVGVEDVTKPGGQVVTRASFIIEAGQSKIHES